MKRIKVALLGLVVTLAIVFIGCCNREARPLTLSGLDSAQFDTIIDGKNVQLITLANANNMEVCLTNYGGRVVSICVPDKEGNATDVVLGYDNIAQYADTLNSPSDYGSSVGRYANRIKDSKLIVGDSIYQLRANDNGNCLHGGGNTGWLNKVYDIANLSDSSVVFAIKGEDKENGFPGNIEATATYTVTSNNTLDIIFEATTDAETVINMTNHCYFNLNGAPSEEGFNQIAYINADYFTPSDELYIPTGDIVSVEDTPMDFRTPKALGEAYDTTYNQIANAMGYDHNWCLNTFQDGEGDDTQVCASLYSPTTGILLEVFTNEPGIQMYTGNFQGNGIPGKHGILYPKHVSVCFESQKYPDSPTKIIEGTKGWEVSNPYLKPGEKYFSHLAYKFSIK